jgi:hypothetical protein
MASERKEPTISVPVVTQSFSAWHALYELYADRLGTIRSLGIEKT